MKWNELLLKMNESAPDTFSFYHLAVNPRYRNNSFGETVEVSSDYDVLDYTFLGVLSGYEVKVCVEEEGKVTASVCYRNNEISFPVTGKDEHFKERLSLQGSPDDIQDYAGFSESLEVIYGWLGKACSAAGY